MGRDYMGEEGGETVARTLTRTLTPGPSPVPSHPPSPGEGNEAEPVEPVGCALRTMSDLAGEGNRTADRRPSAKVSLLSR
jgi:hypothetical protein